MDRMRWACLGAHVPAGLQCRLLHRLRCHSRQERGRGDAVHDAPPPPSSSPLALLATESRLTSMTSSTLVPFPPHTTGSHQTRCPTCRFRPRHTMLTLLVLSGDPPKIPDWVTGGAGRRGRTPFPPPRTPLAG